MLGFQKRNLPLVPTGLKRQLQIAYVRPNLEYASSMWHPGHLTLINKLEAVQNRSARFIISKYDRTASVSSMESSLNLPLLATRQKLSHLCLFNPHWIRPASFISPRLDHMFKVSIPRHNTLTYSQSFVPKTCHDYNQLPASLVSITDTNHFRRWLASIIWITFSSFSCFCVLASVQSTHSFVSFSSFTSKSTISVARITYFMKWLFICSLCSSALFCIFYPYMYPWQTTQ